MNTTPTPSEPPEWTLQRIEALAELCATVPKCDHCKSWPEPLMGPRSEVLPSAVGLRHEPECPVLAVLESGPAVQYEDGEWQQT